MTAQRAAWRCNSLRSGGYESLQGGCQSEKKKIKKCPKGGKEAGEDLKFFVKLLFPLAFLFLGSLAALLSDFSGSAHTHWDVQIPLT